MTTPADFTIRQYRSTDFDAVYAVCLGTGDNGADASHIYRDPQALGHVYVGPYVTLEPGLAFVLEDAEGVCGYVLGALDSDQFQRRYVKEWLPPLQGVVPDPAGDFADLNPDERLYRQLHHPTLEALPPPLQAYPSHLHIDLLPRAQVQGWGRKMLETLLRRLREANSPGVHLGVGAENTRAQGFYRRLEFQDLFTTRFDDSAVVYMGRLL